MTLFSPEKNNPLVVLEGTHADIWARGDQLVTLGETMDKTATSLKKISDGDTQISEAIDTLREAAGGVHFDLTKAAVRYAETGKVLRKYAHALSAGQTNMNGLVTDIEEKDAALRTARAEESSAQRKVNDYDTTWVWEEEATDSQKDAASTALSEASTDRSKLEGELEDLWISYDKHFETWQGAYNDAVNGVEGAIDAADNNDNWFDDALDMFVDLLGWVIVALVIVALFVAAPLAAVLMAVVAVLTIISLLSHIYLYTKGRATVTDIVFDVVGLIPFVKPAITAIRGSSGVFNAASRFTALMNSSGAQAAVGLARSKLTHFMMHGVRGPAAQAAMRSRIAALLQPNAGPMRTALSRILGGNASTAELIILNNHIRTTVLGQSPKMASWLRNPAVLANLPGGSAQAINVANFVVGLDQVGQKIVPAYGDFREKY